MQRSAKIKAATFALLAVFVATATIAASPASPQPLINVRQANFKKMGTALKAINDQLRTDAPAKAAMIGAAQTIAMTAHQQGRLFPGGSGPAVGIKTDALPGIWSDRATFDAQMAKMVVESDKLLGLAKSGDPAAIRAQVKAVGATCGGCHRQFRADN